ncbi:MAG: DUF4144 domain-containing protein [Gammaproteobacteria bacterium]|nr:DUF4144 domain-containing protein [Gammaproteobacteria bacterium]
MINWPAIIKLSDDAELIYVSDQAEWDNDTELHCFVYDETDYLIDSSGHIFKLTNRTNNCAIPDSTDNTLQLTEILGLIKAHAAQQGSCCVAKLFAPTISDAYKIVASMNKI